MAAANVAGISSLGVTFSYGVETSKGVKPTTFTLLNRINEIGGISIEPETIDASALEDSVERSVAGRASTGGKFNVTVNITDETIAEWTTLIDEYNALTDAKKMWFQVSAPGLAKAFFVVGQPPQEIPMPDMSQNELLTVEIPLTIEEYKGMDTKVSAS